MFFLSLLPPPTKALEENDESFSINELMLTLNSQKMKLRELFFHVQKVKLKGLYIRLYRLLWQLCIQWPMHRLRKSFKLNRAYKDCLEIAK